MKNYILILFIISFVSCTSRENKAKEVIKEKLFTILKDYNSYEEIETGKLYKWADSKKHEGIDSIRAVGIYILASQQLISLSKDNKYNDLLKDNGGHSVKSLEDNISKMDKFCTQYNVCDSYLIRQRFRSKNGFGGYGISEYWFKIDKDISKVETMFEIPLN